MDDNYGDDKGGLTLEAPGPREVASNALVNPVAIFNGQGGMWIKLANASDEQHAFGMLNQIGHEYSRDIWTQESTEEMEVSFLENGIASTSLLTTELPRDITPTPAPVTVAGSMVNTEAASIGRCHDSYKLCSGFATAKHSPLHERHSSAQRSPHRYATSTVRSRPCIHGGWPSLTNTHKQYDNARLSREDFPPLPCRCRQGATTATNYVLGSQLPSTPRSMRGIALPSGAHTATPQVPFGVGPAFTGCHGRTSLLCQYGPQLPSLLLLSLDLCHFHPGQCPSETHSRPSLARLAPVGSNSPTMETLLRLPLAVYRCCAFPFKICLLRVPPGSPLWKGFPNTPCKRSRLDLEPGEVLEGKEEGEKEATPRKKRVWQGTQVGQIAKENQRIRDERARQAEDLLEEAEENTDPSLIEWVATLDAVAEAEVAESLEAELALDEAHGEELMQEEVIAQAWEPMMDDDPPVAQGPYYSWVTGALSLGNRFPGKGSQQPTRVHHGDVCLLPPPQCVPLEAALGEELRFSHCEAHRNHAVSHRVFPGIDMETRDKREENLSETTNPSQNRNSIKSQIGALLNSFPCFLPYIHTSGHGDPFNKLVNRSGNLPWASGAKIHVGEHQKN
ncbi:hypothetical protein C8R44DRAFT_724419 [Mycena epipterygia]|nr:hypothetical protein C8R44DRAFT_724419 [Mycena epipterygia]